ncbi:hypothetical protein GCM10020295_07310 [Streptomyces cinereospinus]
MTPATAPRSSPRRSPGSGQGCDFPRLDDDGRIADLTVMVRPLSAARAPAEATGAPFGAVAREAAGS